MPDFRVLSLCYDDIREFAKQGHSAFSRAQNGKIYFNLKLIDRSEKDKYGNDVAAILNPTKERKDEESEKNAWVGNGRIYTYESNQTPNSPAQPLINEEDDDLPF